MSLVQDNEKRMKIKSIFNRYANNQGKIPNQVAICHYVENQEIF